MPKAPHDTELLADEIRASESLFVDAAVAAFRDRVKMEYCRMRGYAIEGEQETMQLQVNVTFGFAPENRFVLVQSVPQFQPARGESRRPVSQPKK